MSRRLAFALLALAASACRTTDSTDGSPVVSIEGAVARPGPQPWDADTTALEAVLRASPIESTCDLSRVELVRRECDGSLAMTLDLRRALDSGDSTFNVLLHRGDVLRVPSR
ncbi:MAG: hypothetical protein HZA52_09030 [Planctomycetes bacterium]|nr:hypothetical protein [Planctomycetota bacterium]